MRLVTWNTQWCCGLDGIVDPQRIVQGARSMGDFDVLCLQEIAVNYPQLEGNAGHDQPALLRQLLPGFELLFGPAVEEWGPQGERRQFGNCIATRLPVAGVVSVSRWKVSILRPSTPPFALASAIAICMPRRSSAPEFAYWPLASEVMPSLIGLAAPWA